MKPIKILLAVCAVGCALCVLPPMQTFLITLAERFVIRRVILEPLGIRIIVTQMAFLGFTLSCGALVWLRKDKPAIPLPWCACILAAELCLTGWYVSSVYRQVPLGGYDRNIFELEQLAGAMKTWDAVGIITNDDTVTKYRYAFVPREVAADDMTRHYLVTHIEDSEEIPQGYSLVARTENFALYEKEGWK